MEEERTIPDYKLDGGFLKDLVNAVLENSSNENLNIKLPVSVQVVNTHREIGEWNSFMVTDGEFQMKRCAFVSKQTKPHNYSILKITKISKLPLDSSNYLENGIIQDVFGEFEFDIEISGERIGYSLCRDAKYINIKEIRELSIFARLAKLKDLFKADSSGEMSMRFMWENRSEKLCSAKFTFSEEQGSVVLAHKSVLMSVSEVFKTHFENDGFVDSDSVAIVDTSFYYFNKFIEFVYLGKVQFTTVKVAFELLYLSKKYLMSKLEMICQHVIQQYSNFASENILKVYIENRKTKDDKIQNHLECNIIRSSYTIREIIHSVDFLNSVNCDISVIEWILSIEDLDVDEWSLLCGLYKWACCNGVQSCDKVKGGSDVSEESPDCLHRLLECIQFENIDMVSLQRFFNLPKLSEIVHIEDFKHYVFDHLLEDEFYFNNLQLGTKSYSEYRGSSPVSKQFYTEIKMEHQQETPMKNIHLKDGPAVLGLKIRVGQKDTTAGEHSVDIFLSFEYLYTENKEENKRDHFCVHARAVEFKSFGKEDIEDVEDSFNGELKVGEVGVLKLHMKDYRNFLSNRIEDFGSERADDSKVEKIFGFEIYCWKYV